MPRNLQDQILVRIVKLSAEVYFQREVARMMGVSQVCISKILWCKRKTGRPHQRRRWGRRILTTAREDRQLVWMVRDKRFIAAPRLRVAMISQFRRRMSIRSIVNRYRHPCSAPRVWVSSTGSTYGTAHARSRSTTYSSLSPRQFHIWSTSVPRTGKPSGDPAAASLIIS